MAAAKKKIAKVPLKDGQAITKASLAKRKSKTRGTVSKPRDKFRHDGKPRSPKSKVIKPLEADPFVDYGSSYAKLALAASGKPAPIDVMFDNMWWAHLEAANIAARLDAALKRAEDLEPDAARESFHLLRELLRIRSIAQSCARDAAPFVHQRLNQVDVTNADGSMKPVIGVIERVIIDGGILQPV